MIAWSVQIRFSGSVEGLHSVHSAASSRLPATAGPRATWDGVTAAAALRRGLQTGDRCRRPRGFSARCPARLEVQWQAAEPLSVKDFPASGMNFQV